MVTNSQKLQGMGQGPCLFYAQKGVKVYREAFLAGLATGVWESEEEVASLWRLERRFEPLMAEEQRQELLDNWHRAVERSRAWEEQ